jgi:uncharacterized protein YybS (DUF2232 family)
VNVRIGAVSLAALSSVLLYVVGRLGPAGAGILGVVLPLPPLIVAGLVGASAAVVSAGLTGTCVGALLGPADAVLYLLTIGFPAIFVASALGRGVRIEGVIALAAGAGLLGIVLLLGSRFGSLADFEGVLRAAWQEGFDGWIEFYGQVGLPAEELGDIEARREELTDAVLGVLPALLTLGIGVVWLTNLLLAGRIVGWPQVQGLRRWEAPNALVWALIAAGFGMFVPLSGLAWLARNVFLIVMACYFCQGLAIVSYYLHRFGLPRALRVVSYLFIAVEQVVAAIVLMLGVFDLWGDFRRLHPVDAPAGPDVD